jgi:hypothetical protein
MDDNSSKLSSDQDSVGSFDTQGVGSIDSTQGNTTAFRSNRSGLTLQADKELLRYLLSPQRSGQFWILSSKKQNILFGAPNSTARKRSRNRKTYLRNLQEEQPSVFRALCATHGLFEQNNTKVEKPQEQQATSFSSPIPLSKKLSHAEAMSARKSRQSLLPAYYGKYDNSDFSY